MPTKPNDSLPQPLKVKCFQCKKIFEVKYVVPNKVYKETKINMNIELFTKELDEIAEKISKLEVQEAEEDNICLERRASWQNLKSEIERKINLIKEMQNSVSTEEKNAYFLLLNRYSEKLGKTEGKLRKIEAHLVNAKSQQITQ
ncbi:3496_t:CDS:2 [Scutellospora calospora]|uniref:3496_t:CDS:1 n=1 Tax=Scutellospora calospora TaxID=85575 RepID=A0ACA9MBR7_9GLOM|nr:3496_t:CDS:2 [Scutellospora calospora]